MKEEHVKSRRSISTLLTFLLFSILLAQPVSGTVPRVALLKQIRQTMVERFGESIAKTVQVHRLDSLIQLNDITDNVFVMSVTNIGEYYHERGRLIDAVELFLKVVSHYEQEISTLTPSEMAALIQLYIPLGAAHDELGMRNRAILYYFKALSLADGAHYDKYRAMLYNNIGNVYMERNEDNKALVYQFKALAINRKINNKKEMFYNYNNIANIYQHRNQMNLTLDYALRAIQLLDPGKDPYLYYFMQSNIASIYIQRRDFALAMSYLRNAMTHQQLYGYSSDLIQTYFAMSDLYKQTGRKDSSLIYLQRAYKDARLLKNANLEKDAQQFLSDYYASVGNYAMAYKCLQRSTALGDSLVGADNNRNMRDMERIYDVDKKVRENELLIKNITLEKVNAERLWIIMAVVVLALVVTIGFLVYRARNKEKQRQTLAEMSKQKNAFFEKEKQLQLQKEQEMEKVLDQRNRELTSYTLYMMKSNEFISDISEELKQLLLNLTPKDRTTYKAVMQSIQSKLQQQNSNNSWDEFRYYFEQVHPSFYEHLEKKCPDLTVKEKRLCAFLRLGLASKDIAAITYTEVRSVESARNRLRKKLNISSEENLIEFLTQNFEV